MIAHLYDSNAETYKPAGCRAAKPLEVLDRFHRQEKLLALGSGRKSAVIRAEEKVAALKQQKSEEQSEK
ncbi:MAG: hypothetical protein ABJB22_06890 [Verrucomicrobiota bacterium]